MLYISNLNDDTCLHPQTPLQLVHTIILRTPRHHSTQDPVVLTTYALVEASTKVQAHRGSLSESSHRYPDPSKQRSEDLRRSSRPLIASVAQYYGWLRDLSKEILSLTAFSGVASSEEYSRPGNLQLCPPELQQGYPLSPALLPALSRRSDLAGLCRADNNQARVSQQIHLQRQPDSWDGTDPLRQANLRPAAGYLT